MPKHYLATALLLFALLSPVVAIADANQSGDDSKGYTIFMRNHKFDPFELVVPAKQKVTLIVRNMDTAPIEFDSSQLGHAKIVQPGGTIMISLNPLDPGTYGYSDAFHDDSKAFITAK